MKKETTPKKVWKKPEVQDLDVKNTEAKSYFPSEHFHSVSSVHGPGAS